jgi:hypothetical protein
MFELRSDRMKLKKKKDELTLLQEIRDLVVKYREDLDPVLRGVSCSIKSGEKVYLKHSPSLSSVFSLLSSHSRIR